MSRGPSREELDATLHGLSHAPNLDASQIAAKAAELIGGDREKTHGEKHLNFSNIATLWNAFLAIKLSTNPGDLTAADVAKMMTLLKLARMETGKHNPDDAIDACGYSAIAGELSQHKSWAAL